MTNLIAEKKRELIQLEYAYQLLQIKTPEYRETKKRLEKEMDSLIGLDADDLAKKERKAKKKQRASFEGKLEKSYTGKDKTEPMQIVGEEDITRN